MLNNLSKSRVYLAGICSLIVTVGVARFSYTPLLPIMQAETGLTDAGGGWLATANYMGYMLGVLTAASMNSLHHKYLLHQLYLILSVITSIAMVFTTDIYLWSFFRLVAGICASGGMIIASGLILKWLVMNKYRGELGVHFAGIGISIIFTALIVEGLLMLSADWEQQWLFFAGVAAVFAVPAWLWIPHPKADANGQAQVIKDNPPSKTFSRIMLLAYFCAGYGYVVSATFIVDIVEGFAALEGKGPLAFVVIGLGAMPAVIFWDRVARKVGYLKALIGTYGLQIFGIMVPAFSDSLVFVLLSALIFGGTFVACVSLVLTMAGQFYPSNPAKFMGKMTLAYGTAQILAPVCTGYLAEALGDYSLGLYISAAVMVVGLVLILCLVMLEKRELSQLSEAAMESNELEAPKPS
ncbi:YbfB/YjiJ family MFS transporter [Neptuniibacter caesariensis]|nr:YbfB/YjiJ family MFS transporter [Neptuniibacter caesariensis]